MKKHEILIREIESGRHLKDLSTDAARSVLDSLTENLAVLNEKGVIVSANSSWTNFSSDNGGSRLDRAAVGENYLRAFRDAFGGDTKFARTARAIRSVLTGERGKYSTEYTCDLPDGKKWFRFSATAIKNGRTTTGAVVSHTDITRRKLAESETKRLAVLDPMTGILNRKSGVECIERHMKASKKRRRHLTVCYIDLDNLKSVNDNYGHREGDRAIRAAVSLIKKAIRSSDTMCRLGGDEILIVFPDTGIDQSMHAVERITELMEQRNAKSSAHWKMQFSYGLAEYTPAMKCRAEDLIEIADKNMYLMKMSKKYKKGVN